jgi:hypothetical protein
MGIGNETPFAPGELTPCGANRTVGVLSPVAFFEAENRDLHAGDLLLILA